MKNNALSLALVAGLVATTALVGCKKKEEAVVTPPPADTTTAPMPAPAPAPAAATAMVSGVDLGNAVGADMKVSMPMTTFKPSDKIIAAVSTSTSDAAATVPGKLGAKWTYDNNGSPMTVNDETKDVNFAGAGVTDFQISKPSGFPVGKYKVEVSLNGSVVQTKEFTVAK